MTTSIQTINISGICAPVARHAKAAQEAEATYRASLDRASAEIESKLKGGATLGHPLIDWRFSDLRRFIGKPHLFSQVTETSMRTLRACEEKGSFVLLVLPYTLESGLRKHFMFPESSGTSHQALMPEPGPLTHYRYIIGESSGEQIQFPIPEIASTPTANDAPAMYGTFRLLMRNEHQGSGITLPFAHHIIYDTVELLDKPSRVLEGPYEIRETDKVTFLATALFGSLIAANRDDTALRRELALSIPTEILFTAPSLDLLREQCERHIRGSFAHNTSTCLIDMLKKFKQPAMTTA